MRVLIYGLSGAGKSVLTEKLATYLEYPIICGEEIRRMYDDWDFSPDGRLKHANRIADLADTQLNVIIDMVCPLEAMRKIIAPDITILMDTIPYCQYEDTNHLFEKGNPSHTIHTFDYDIEKLLEGHY